MNLDLKLKTIIPDKKAEVTFSELEKNLENRPFVVYFPDDNYDYRYLKMRSARDNDGNLKKIKNKEIFVPKNSNEDQFLDQDYYIDTTKIFNIKQEEFDRFMNWKEIYNIEEIDPVYGSWIYCTLIKNLRQKPPLCSLITVNFDQDLNKFISRTEYAHRELLDYEYDQLIDEEKTKYDKVYRFLIKNRCKATFKILRNCESINNGFDEDYHYHYSQYRYHIDKNTDFCDEIEKLFIDNWNYFQNKNLSNEDIKDGLEKFDQNLKNLLSNKYVPLKNTRSRKEIKRQIMLVTEWLKDLNQTKLILTPTELVTLKNNCDSDLVYKIVDPKTNEILLEYLKDQGIKIDVNDVLKEKYYFQYMVINEYIQKVNLEYLKNKSES
ncbi:hypothetical protein MCAV_02320 [[Mycoplasma] cavipharyngis]|uniref:Mbov_0400 family ICE element protein n=1 Tax=[Mycoplasma] cavipharyngis TaxID=92757 RepID=UPI003703B62E